MDGETHATDRKQRLYDELKKARHCKVAASITMQATLWSQKGKGAEYQLATLYKSMR